MDSWNEDCAFPVDRVAYTDKQLMCNNGSSVNCDEKMNKNVSNEYNAGRVYEARLFYNSKCNPKDIESSLVRPFGASVRTFKALVCNKTYRSYASVVVGDTKSVDRVGGIAHANYVQCTTFVDLEKPITKHMLINRTNCLLGIVN